MWPKPRSGQESQATTPKRWRSGVLKRGAGQARFARFLAHESAHGMQPNALRRGRSQKAGQLCAALHDPATQILGLLLCRYHNAPAAFDDFPTAHLRDEREKVVLHRQLQWFRLF